MGHQYIEARPAKATLAGLGLVEADELFDYDPSLALYGFTTLTNLIRDRTFILHVR